MTTNRHENMHRWPIGLAAKLMSEAEIPRTGLYVAEVSAALVLNGVMHARDPQPKGKPSSFGFGSLLWTWEWQ